MENIKTLGQLLQEIVENDWDRWYSLYDFLTESTEEDRKRIERELLNADATQLRDYLNGYSFVNKQEVYTAVCEYTEHVNQRPLCMGEMGDIWEVAEDYLRETWLDLPEES